ncbi:tRNA lysidine(34) synthetase TilS [Pseudoprimorskyibacter insulae]|uniref:tRNA(Ile)-lysidine synthase n=1 Tax=Pseudoprimorskyibacter insulae TaxID=1695997 RepID=A0A2R8AVC7_9RHOB|nr:tRNA lysidine(34) synthetase TilS [Pseudoprimorskyibacter insulae]SPF79982.1 tRNA(Ile)-lysidine synthase [Pseudoprimorskyibacter insulae]
MTSLDDRFAAAMGQLLGPDFPDDIALAVSGGGDSMAMLYLAHNWTRVWGVRLHVCTVDHGFRPEAAAEAQLVADECAVLGWPHATLRWHWDGRGNKMDAARQGRLDAIGQWRGQVRHVLVAHTKDDVAETFLMRLARGSGVDGLSAMQSRRTVAQGFDVLRPCLDMQRDELRHYLKVLHGRWVDDPSNEDDHYDRARIRKLLPVLAAEGLTVENLAATSDRMGRAKEALRLRAAEAWDQIGTAPHQTGDLLFARDGFEALDRDTQLRLLAAALQFVASAEYRPRAEPLEALLDRLLGGGAGTLHGCEARCERAAIRVYREFAALQGATPHKSGALWDNRWRICSSLQADLPDVTVRALGEDGWQQVAQRPQNAPPFHAARSLPSLWQGDNLLACAALGVGSGHTTDLWPLGREAFGFRQFLLSH